REFRSLECSFVFLSIKEGWPLGCGFLALLRRRCDLLIVQSLGDLLGVAFVVQSEQAGVNFSPGRFADRIADASLCRVETVTEIVPAVGSGYGIVHLDVEFTEFLNVVTNLIRVMKTIVDFGQALLPRNGHRFSVFIILLSANRYLFAFRHRKRIVLSTV